MEGFNSPLSAFLILYFFKVFKVRCKEDNKLYAVKRSRERFKGEADK